LGITEDTYLWNLVASIQYYFTQTLEREYSTDFIQSDEVRTGIFETYPTTSADVFTYATLFIVDAEKAKSHKPKLSQMMQDLAKSSLKEHA
jgi:hypothetical protein